MALLEKEATITDPIIDLMIWASHHKTRIKTLTKLMDVWMNGESIMIHRRDIRGKVVGKHTFDKYVKRLKDAKILRQPLEVISDQERKRAATGRGYWILNLRGDNPLRPEILMFHNWLRRTLAQSIKRPTP